MASFAEPVVTELTIDARSAEQGSAQYVRAMANAQAAMERQTAASARLWEANDKQLRVTQQVTAANDNFLSKWKAVNDNVSGSVGIFGDVSEQIANTTKHLLQAGIAAYNFFPAFRALVNPSITNALKAIGPTVAGSLAMAFEA